VSEKVEVTDVAAQLDTLTSDLGQAVQGDQIEDLPLNGRNFAQVALLTAGVSPGEPGGRATGNYGFSSNGARSYQNNFMLDGIDNNSNLTDLFNGASYVTEVSVDSLQEMRVQTNAYSAEFSRGVSDIVQTMRRFAGGWRRWVSGSFLPLRIRASSSPRSTIQRIQSFKSPSFTSGSGAEASRSTRASSPNMGASASEPLAESQPWRSRRCSVRLSTYSGRCRFR